MSDTVSSTIRDRITEIVTMRLGDLLHNPANWKTHPQKQKDQIRGIIEDLGFGDVVKAYWSKRSGQRQLTLLDGHGRKEVMPDADVKVAILDFTDEEADRYLATFDTIGEGAELDPEAWLALTKEMKLAGAVKNMVGEKVASAELLLQPFDPDSVEFPEYDESIVDTVEYHECSECGHKWPK